MSPDEEFAEVRLSFLARLSSERTKLAKLSNALASAALNPAPLFSDLEYFAHRLRGAAAVFEFPTLRDAAKALELAAGAAVSARAPNFEPLVLKAMQALDTRLAYLSEGTLSSAAAVAPAPAN
ncbi:MAG TPA: Hpt domain-containing protein [Steroidobacteraceae bacterium]|nr:Hpt domain-containing protein [Steroidobacteraceae bacterium]